MQKVTAVSSTFKKLKRSISDISEVVLADIALCCAFETAMACKCEKDGPTLASNAIRSTKALNETHQEIKQLVDAIVAAKDVPT